MGLVSGRLGGLQLGVEERVLGRGRRRGRGPDVEVRWLEPSTKTLVAVVLGRDGVETE